MEKGARGRLSPDTESVTRGSAVKYKKKGERRLSIRGERSEPRPHAQTRNFKSQMKKKKVMYTEGALYE